MKNGSIVPSIVPGSEKESNRDGINSQAMKPLSTRDSMELCLLCDFKTHNSASLRTHTKIIHFQNRSLIKKFKFQSKSAGP